MAHVATSMTGKLTFQVQLEHGMSDADDWYLESVEALTQYEVHTLASKKTPWQ